MQNQMFNDISSVAGGSAAQINNSSEGIISQLEQALVDDYYRVQDLLRRQIITKSQGQDFLLKLAIKANEITNYKNSLSLNNNSALNAQTSIQPLENNTLGDEEQINYLEMFKQENPEFFNGKGRGAVLDYIKDMQMNKDEIGKIAELVESLESSAIDNYLQKSAHEKSLNDENLAAKSRLTAYAQTANGGNTFDRIFTREDIGNMSGEEFAKNEKLIMEQAKKGLIK